MGDLDCTLSSKLWSSLNHLANKATDGSQSLSLSLKYKLVKIKKEIQGPALGSAVKMSAWTLTSHIRLPRFDSYLQCPTNTDPGKQH